MTWEDLLEYVFAENPAGTIPEPWELWPSLVAFMLAKEIRRR